MCIAILNQTNLIDRESLKNCWDSNNDGAGLMCVIGGKLVTHKEMRDFDAFYKKYETLRKKTKSKFLLHFRIATQGEKTELNCHPFQINPTLGYCHNGMLREMPHHARYSDTYLLNSLILSKFPIGFEKAEDFKTVMTIFTGTISNKLIFLNTDNEHYIINESLGHWKDGNWFSNYSYNRTKVNTYNTYNSPNHVCGTCKNKVFTIYDNDECWQCSRKNNPIPRKFPASAECDLCGLKDGVSTDDEVGVSMCKQCSQVILAYN